MDDVSRVVVIGLDGLEPVLVEDMLARGELPHLARVRARGGYGRLATTTPAQTPVAWSTFATGRNPGGHGIFDFLRRDPATYLPDLALSDYERRSPLLPPRAVNRRSGEPLWSHLSAAGIPCEVIRCPCTFPPDEVRGRMLSGMGVPDIRGGLGTSTFFTSERGIAPGEGEQVVRLAGDGRSFRSKLIGPRNPKTLADIMCDFTLDVDAAANAALLRAAGHDVPLALRRGTWSEWLHVRFRAGPLSTVHGMVRFLLLRVDGPVELYASPVNFDPGAPLFPISHPADWADDLARAQGDFCTAGIVEDHTGLLNGRLQEDAFLALCDDAMRERERMLLGAIERVREGLVFCLFDTPDRLQHMFWRFREPDHPANRHHPLGLQAFAGTIEDHYRDCDAVVGRAMEAAGEDALIIVLSDHGFCSFRRGVHINQWLHRQGLLVLHDGVPPGPQAGEFLGHVDWGRTRAYALGFGGIYLNQQGREAEGVVPPEDAEALAEQIAGAITGIVDTQERRRAIRGAKLRRDLYRGPRAAESPDVVLAFEAGYRASWTTALGGVPDSPFEDNVRKWGGDHIVDPALVPGVLFMNRSFDASGSRLVDLAPTILGAFGVPPGAAMEGRSLDS